MAVYITDSGTYSNDALFNGTKSTDYNYDDSTGSETVWFTATGYATIPYTFAEEAWIAYEIYDVNGTTNPLYSSGTVRGHLEWTNDITTAATDIETWFDAFKISTIGSGYSEWKMKATWYKGSDVASVYTALHSDTNITLSIDEGEYTLTGADHKIMDALLADDVTISATDILDTITSQGSNGSPLYDVTGTTVDVVSDGSASGENENWLLLTLTQAGSTTATYELKFDAVFNSGTTPSIVYIAWAGDADDATAIDLEDGVTNTVTFPSPTTTGLDEILMVFEGGTNEPLSYDCTLSNMKFLETT